MFDNWKISQLYKINFWIASIHFSHPSETVDFSSQMKTPNMHTLMQILL